MGGADPALRGLYELSEIAPTSFNGGKPIYTKHAEPQQFLYFEADEQQWCISSDHQRRAGSIRGQGSEIATIQVWFKWSGSEYIEDDSIIVVAKELAATTEAPGNNTGVGTCAFELEPLTPYYWDRGCYMGLHGCNADGKNVQCRFCGEGGFSDILCPRHSVCEFEVEPTTEYFWDPECHEGDLGCMADGVHPECRFCGSESYEAISCPAPPTLAPGQCHWPPRGEPAIPFFWDETCEVGQLGCMADGIHEECRFCGAGVYSEVPCPDDLEMTESRL